MRGPGALAGVVLALAGAIVPSATAQPWRPSMHRAELYARGRGPIAFAVRTPIRAWGWHKRETFPSASVLKAMLLVAYLERPSVRHRALEHRERALLGR